MAFDHTYLSPTFSQTTLRQTRCLVGGIWQPGHEEEAFLDMSKERISIKGLQKASAMLECAVWDPTSRKKAALSACCMPMSPDFGKCGGGARGSAVMLETSGMVLSKSQNTLQGVVFDAASSHSFIRRIIHGTFLDVSMELVEATPFFKDLRHIDLPLHPLPRMPVKICLVGDQPFYGMIGPCDLTALEICKNI